MSFSHPFGIVDYVLLGLVLCISSCIGLYYRFTGGKQKTTKEYLLADGSMSMIPVAFSLMASFMSAITILGVSMEVYSYGFQFFVINISYIIATPLVCYFYLPVFYRLQRISVYEYLQGRFGKAVRIFASLAFTLQMTLYMGIVLFAPAIALSAVTGISQTISIISIGLVCTFYSTIGGMKAVLFTDVFQSLLMFAAVYMVIIKGLIDHGFSNIIQYALEGDRMDLGNISPDPRVRHTVWSLGIGGVFTYCSLYGVNQAQVQRLLSVRSLKEAQKSLVLQWIILLCLSLSTCFSGLVLYAQYRNCDPKLSGSISNQDQIMPFFVKENLSEYPGLLGLFVSGIFSGSLSTVSSALNSLSAVTMQDYLMPIFPSLSRSETSGTFLSKIISVVFGLLCIGMAFLMDLLGTGVLQASLTIFGAVGGPLLGLFTLGMLVRWANHKGSLFGLLVGLSLTLWIGFGRPKPCTPYQVMATSGCEYSGNSTLSGVMGSNCPDKQVNYVIKGGPWFYEYGSALDDIYGISYAWIAAIGFISTLFSGMLMSLVTGGNKKSLDKKYLSQIVWTREEKHIFNEKGGIVDLEELTDGDVILSNNIKELESSQL